MSGFEGANLTREEQIKRPETRTLLRQILYSWREFAEQAALERSDNTSDISSEGPPPTPGCCKRAGDRGTEQID